MHLKNEEKLAPRARFELATLRLTAECSTIELPGNRKAGTNGTEKVYRSALAGVKQVAFEPVRGKLSPVSRGKSAPTIADIL
jgi:hypothetical protein